MNIAQTNLSEAGIRKVGRVSPLRAAPGPSHPGAHGVTRPTRSADFQVCWVAGFQTRAAREFARPADLEIGDTAGLETCATNPASVVSLTPWLQPGVKRNRETPNRFNGFPSRAEAVETAGDFPARPVHRAEATVLMRAGN